MWKKLSDWWTKAWLEGEDIEYYRYLRQHPVRAEFIRGKTKAELAQELHDWKVRSTEQGITAIQLQAEICRLTTDNLKQFANQELQTRRLALAEYYTRHNPNDLPDSELPRQTQRG